MAKVQKIELKPITVERITMRIVGDSEIITHRWAEKDKGQIRDKQQQKAKQPRGAKDTFAEYKGACYPMNATDMSKITTQKQLEKLELGIPAMALKNCGVSACASLDMTKVLARAAFHVMGERVKIEGKPVMREDTVSVGMGTDLRYRPGFWPWAMQFDIRYNSGVISAEQLVNIFGVGGFGIGLCEWRPEKNGQYGLFHVEASK